jgi:hypothetical protein
MKTGFLIVVLLTVFIPLAGNSQSFLEKTKLALKSGNSQKIIQMMGDKLQFGFEGEATMMTSKEAGNRLAAFFKSNVPSDVSPLFQGQSKDGRQYFIGILKTPSGEFRVSVYWTEAPKEQILTFDITKE